jgi:hypothetical protein
MVAIDITDFSTQLLIGLASVVSGAISAIVTYYLGVLKAKRDLQFEYDKKLHDERLAAYKGLWKLFEPLAKYSPPSTITYKTVRDLSANMRQWYYETGGIFLSTDARVRYFAVQDAIKEILDKRNSAQDADPLKREQIKMVFDKGSELRTIITKDLRSRARAVFSGEQY